MIELTKGNTTAKGRLRLELAGEAGAGEVVHEIRKRLATIARSQAFVDWQDRKTLIADLEMPMQTILRQVAEHDPKIAFDLMWQYLGLANGIYLRCDDSFGQVQDVFQEASDAVVEFAHAARPEPIHLANLIMEALSTDDYGHFPSLIPRLSVVLGPLGLAHLKSRLMTNEARALAGYARKSALQMIADATGGVESLVAEQSRRSLTVPQVAANIAERFLRAGRAEEALEVFDNTDLSPRDRAPEEWELARITAPKALGRSEAAQAFRLTSFEASLNPEHFGAYLKALSEFEEIEAEDRALKNALTFPDFHTALYFLIKWPALQQAALLVVDGSGQIDGN